MGPYDVVLASEVLERIPSPKALLGKLQALAGLVLSSGGLGLPACLAPLAIPKLRLCRHPAYVLVIAGRQLE